MTNENPDTMKLVKLWIEWLRDQQIGDLVEKNHAREIVRELLEDEETEQATRRVFEEGWSWINEELEKEDRTVRAVLGETFTSTVVEYMENHEPDEETVRLLLRNEAAESLFGEVLYEGITEFLNRVDIINAILDRLPLIGGLKGKIQDNFPDGVASLAEGKVKSFLGNFSGAAAQKAVNYVLSSDYENKFGNVQANLVEHLLDYSVDSYAPSEELRNQWKNGVWSGLQNALQDPDRTPEKVGRLYEQVESISLRNFIPEKPPTMLVVFISDKIDEFLSENEVTHWFENEL